MGFFKIIKDYISKEKNINYSNKIGSISIDKNYIFPFKEKIINLREDENIEYINGKHIYFIKRFKINENNFYKNFKIEDNLRLFYSKKDKVKDIIKNFKIFLYPQEKIYFDEYEDKIIYINLGCELNDDFLFKLSPMINILCQVKWIQKLDIIDKKILKIFLIDDETISYSYEIIKRNHSKIIGYKNKEYVIIDMEKKEIKIGRAV